MNSLKWLSPVTCQSWRTRLPLSLSSYFSVVQTLCVQNKQLEDAHMNANLRVSNHKQATQLLQTELQDSRAQVEEKENTIQTLKSKLRESEVCA